MIAKVNICCSDLLNAPVRRIDEILALPHSVDDFKDQEVPPSDDDSWLYGGEEELNSVLMDKCLHGFCYITGIKLVSI